MANGARTLPVERRYRAAVSGTTVSPRFSAFAAALLSALIPGLGQAYQRRWGAALALVAPPFLLSAVVGGIYAADGPADRKSTRLNSSHMSESRMPSSA